MEYSIPKGDITSPQPLPSLPPSPATSEDLSRAHAWADTEDNIEPENIPQKSDKGKGREIINLNVEEHRSGETSEEEGGGLYPPMNGDAAETRRIEDNLRQWELAERQRRKAARESTQASSTSLVADVTRRASLFWPGSAKHVARPSRNERNGLGNHTALASVDSVDVVPMDNIAASPTLSATTSPGSSPRGPNSPVNPFIHPSDSLTLYNDSHEPQTAVMDGSSMPPTPSPKAKRKGVSRPERPTLRASTSSFSKRNRPKPLGLPSPRTPPPKPIASPIVAAVPRELEEPKERWWHDWLCGCSEGEDRGGDNQAGRTNPFE